MSDPLAKKAIDALGAKNFFLSTAESCTGGLVAVALTDQPGASKIFDRGFVTYSNEAKMDILGVPKEILEQHGAVSEENAKAMAEGILRKIIKSNIAVSITGIAGPGGDGDGKPVGLVYIGMAQNDRDTQVFRHQFSGDRDAVRRQTVDAVFTHLIERAQEK